MKALAIILIIAVGGYFFLMSHTQIIVGAIQKLSQDTVNTKNLYSPLGRATSFTRGERGGGQVNNVLTKRIKRGQVESISRGELNEADRHRGIVGGAVRNRGQEATVGESSA